MNRLALLCTAGVLSLALTSQAAFPLKVINGNGTIVSKATSERITIADSSSLDFGDSLILSPDNQVSVFLEVNSKILLKGPLTITLNGDKANLKAILTDGQLFLDRNQQQEIANIQIICNGYNFQPIGTSAAVKTSKNSNPSTAVLKGQMKMTAPTGESIVVYEGDHGSVDQNGNLTAGKLSPKAIENLQAWRDVVSNNEPLPQMTSEATPSTAPATSVEPSVSQPEPPKTQPVIQDPVHEKKSVAGAVSNQAAAQVNSESPEAKTKGSDAEKAPKEENSSKESKSAEKSSVPVKNPSAGQESPLWEIGAGTVTVDNKQWTRLAVGLDVPIWKFGIFFDVELFIDNQGKISDKGWNFKDDWVDAITRKIRYIRFGHEDEPLFIKFGGLSSVTLGYGFLVDRFTNMLHYPDQKLLGLQFNLNDISPIGVTLQTMIADFRDFKNDGGVLAARLALTPLKLSNIPIIKGVSIGGTYAKDLNQFAPARKWDYSLNLNNKGDIDEDDITDSNATTYSILRNRGMLTPELRQEFIDSSVYDTIIEHKDKWASREDDPYGLIGADIGIPLISTSLLNLDLYGQAGIRDDGKHGWGIGAPGVSLKLWKLWAAVEYRRIQGRFAPGYFGTYYLDERLQRVPEITTKEALLASDNLNGVFGRLGFNVANVLIVDGSYQYMIGSADTIKDQRFEISSSIGDLIVKKIPKLSKAEIYLHKTRIGSEVVGFDASKSKYEYDRFFDKTPFLYWGYRVGFEITQGAVLIFDSRYGFKRSGPDGFKMVPDNNISIQTAITF